MVHNVLYVPDLSQTLASVLGLIEGSKDILAFSADNVYLHEDSTGETLLIGKRFGMLYHLLSCEVQAVVARQDPPPKPVGAGADVGQVAPTRSTAKPLTITIPPPQGARIAGEKEQPPSEIATVSKLASDLQDMEIEETHA
ncbi:hypothetical protein HDU96_007950 [Phlyctochytrium bullatum]|nr:hypothetical protein HDU96_007950 [Phlyctochytrium bullatum]